MDRREWLKATAGLFAWGSFTKDLWAFRDRPLNFGWARDANPYFGPVMSQYGKSMRGKGKGKVVRLWKLLEEAQGHSFDNYIQTEGTCVSQAAALGATTLSAVQAVARNRGIWKGHYAAEPIYAGSKVEIGIDSGYVSPSGHWSWRTFDGTRCQYAVEWMEQYGLILRGKYGKYDLSKTDCQMAVNWTRKKSGVPQLIEEKSKENPLLMAVRIDGGWDQAVDCMAHGYPIIIGSSVGYKMRRGRDGLLDPAGTWMHAMLLWGFDTLSMTHAGCIANSWPRNWVRGPTYKYAAPASSFWTESRNVDKMLRQGNSYALCDLYGHHVELTDYGF